jgi:hypothetical protein
LCTCGKGLAGTDAPARLLVLVQALFMLPNMAANEGSCALGLFLFSGSF